MLLELVMGYLLLFGCALARIVRWDITDFLRKKLIWRKFDFFIIIGVFGWVSYIANFRQLPRLFHLHYPFKTTAIFLPSITAAPVVREGRTSERRRESNPPAGPITGWKASYLDHSATRPPIL